MRDPNEPVHLKPLNPRDPRDLGSQGTGSIAHDGYDVVARRPRVRGMDDTVSPERADRIERIFGVGDDNNGNDLGY